MNRAAGGRELFSTATDCALFLESVGEASQRYAVEVHAYCLMTNHFHLLLRSKRGRLSDFMRFAVGRFTRLHNVRRCTDGAVFRGRFVSRSVDDDSHLLECLRYIHLNPVDAGLTRRAEAWPWSSAGAYDCSAQSPPWLVMDALLEMFGSSQAREQYRRVIDDGMGHLDGVRPRGSDTA